MLNNTYITLPAEDILAQDESYGDSTQLLYLRARYYNPADGRFTSRDTWGGDANRPMSMNRWGYVEGNPVNYFDPSGHIAEGHEARTADVIRDKLKIFYGVEIHKDWGYLNEFFQYPNMLTNQ
ncbi:RHS repeat-associated core domain-containing protein [Candidatus Villigracilis saccharophilus]|uniref:RHS repeat-associated core domain-containing protein n=1 Tax=Candidatus Villigracilis saccharophilus TaxID=3140684 RepID=UPI003134AC99|nr:hypothetical protein [Anaerolineales bacterium]